MKIVHSSWSDISLCTSCLSDVVIGFPVGATVNVTERISINANICPQILEGTLERQVSVFATTMDGTAIGTAQYTVHIAQLAVFISSTR